MSLCSQYYLGRCSVSHPSSPTFSVFLLQWEESFSSSVKKTKSFQSPRKCLSSFITPPLSQSEPIFLCWVLWKSTLQSQIKPIVSGSLDHPSIKILVGSPQVELVPRKITSLHLHRIQGLHPQLNRPHSVETLVSIPPLFFFFFFFWAPPKILGLAMHRKDPVHSCRGLPLSTLLSKQNPRHLQSFGVSFHMWARHLTNVLLYLHRSLYIPHHPFPSPTVHLIHQVTGKSLLTCLFLALAPLLSFTPVFVTSEWDLTVHYAYSLHPTPHWNLFILPLLGSQTLLFLPSCLLPCQIKGLQS